ncbi:hypothetical protein [Alteromonas sp. CYL-A6]|uniref:hypothetical protein n=1 Tax=Alteromonas nitratireducens TaxID=3390813 RepID=UPI0034C2AF0C
MIKSVPVAALLLCSSVAIAAPQDDDPWSDWDMEAPEANPITGFVEVASSQRLQNDPAINSDTTLGDVRAQIKWDKTLTQGAVSFTSDIYYDGVLNDTEFQLRELYWQGNLGFLGEAGKRFDLKAGQQILTWGTGDYLFLNDLFAKDFQSFFSGRNDEYLKAPSFSIKLSGFFDIANVDLVVTPRFAPDTYINGDYFSFFNPMLGTNIAPGFTVSGDNRPDVPEWAMRIYKSVDGVDLALYGYRGFHKSPNSFDEQGQPRFARLNVTGASAIWTALDGLMKAEYAFYNSIEDPDGNNPFVPNDQSRFLVGYERELIANLTGSAQWYLEHNHDYDALIAASPWPVYEPEENRHVITAQLSYRMLQDTLTLNWFTFYSPTDDDAYSRFRATYSPVDDWALSGGLNLFTGDKPFTFFGQFEDASNVFASFRYYY